MRERLAAGYVLGIGTGGPILHKGGWVRLMQKSRLRCCLGRYLMYHRPMVKKALIVDDLPFDVALTRRVLQGCAADHEVVVVSDGEEALRALGRAHDFDVVLLDLNLPKVDGFEVLKTIASTPFLSDVPVIVLSSSRNDSDRVRTRMLGAGDFVEKAIDYAVFKAELTRALAQSGFGCA